MQVRWPNFKRTIDGNPGLITVVVQDYGTREVLMVAFSDEAGWKQTLQTGMVSLYSTSRKKSWVKGEQSGNFMKVVGTSIDCDGDAVICYVIPMGEGVACHTGAATCFYRAGAGEIQLYQAPNEGPGEALALQEFAPHADIQF